MNTDRRLIVCVLLGILFATPSCGKKGPPFLTQKSFPLKVVDLRGERANEYMLLKGDIHGPGRGKKAIDLIKGCRVYYGHYPYENPPCADCPIEYHGYRGFGPEVITEEGLLCTMPVKMKRGHYFFKVHLIGPDGALGLPSNRVRVVVK